jgi:hypothetical protein
MKLFRRLSMVFALLLCSLFAVPQQPAYAWGPFDGVKCTGAVNESTVCADKSKSADPIAGSGGLIMKIINILAFVAGLAAVIIIILAALRFVTSGGSSEDVAGARRTLIYALVGLVILILARTLVAFTLGRI